MSRTKKLLEEQAVKGVASAQVTLDSRTQRLLAEKGNEATASAANTAVRGFTHQSAPASLKEFTNPDRTFSAKPIRYSPVKSLAAVAQKGINSAATRFGDTLAFVEDAAFSIPEQLMGMEAGTLSDNAPLNQLAQGAREAGERIDTYYRPNMERGGWGAETFENLGSATVAAVPQAVLAMLTGGSSLAAQGTAGVAAASKAAMSPGVTSTIQRVVEQTAKNPAFWSSFAMSAGPSYEQALADGADPARASLNAVGNGLLNAAVEVGGGVETLPAEMRNQSAWKAWVKSALDEGKEEAVQGVIERAMQNLTYDKGNALASWTDEGAVINPVTAGKEFVGGAAVGGVLGGAQIGASKLLSSAQPTPPHVSQNASAQQVAADTTPTQNVAQNQQGRAQAGVSKTEKATAAAPDLLSALDALGPLGKTQGAAFYQEGQSVPDYYGEWAAYYNAGTTGKDIAQVKAPSTLNPAQREAAYLAGQADAQEAFSPGLVRDDFVLEAIESGRTLPGSKTGETYLTGEVADRMDAVAKALGVRVRFVDSVKDGTANASIQGSEVLVEKNNPNPVVYLLGHEFTHRMQELAPEQYRAFRDSVAGEAEVQDNIEDLTGHYAPEDVLDEAVANYAGAMMQGGKVLDDFIERHRTDKTLLEKVRDAIRAVVAKLTGAEKRQAQTAEGKLTAALEAASKAALQESGRSGRMGKTKYSKKYWKPKLTQAEWEMLNQARDRQFGLESHRLGDLESWVYTAKNGRAVFAIYSTVDQDDPTLFYACNGALAEWLGKNTSKIREVFENVTFGNVETAHQKSEVIRRELGKLRHTDRASVRGAGGGTDAGVDDRARGRNGIGNRGDGSENSGYAGNSLKTDTQGRELSEGQREYFKDSKAVDGDGNLLVVHHATDGDFTVFDRNKLGLNTDSNATDEVWAATAHIGFWFNENDLSARIYMERDMEGYLNIENPYHVNSLQSLADQLADMSDLDDTPNDLGTRFQEWLKTEGYDGIVLDDEEFGGRSFVALDSEQFKRTDNINPTTAPDIRYSLKGSELPRETLDRLSAQYGSIPAGERPHRKATVPKKTASNKKVSQTVRTILEAQATPDELVPSIEELTAKGEFSYEVCTDKQAVSEAEDRIRRKTPEGAFHEWLSDVEHGRVSKDNTALGWALYNHAANEGKTQTALTILTKMVEHQRSAAQALQATRILKKLSPETQLYGVQRSVQNLQDELNQRYGRKHGVELEIDPELAEQFLQARDQHTRDEVLKDIYRDIGRQLPSNWRDKWNAWRYLAMLGNPRTHVRNVVGNAGFAPVVAAKNAVATTIESAVYTVSGGKLERSKALVLGGRKDRALLSAAWGDYAKVQETSLSGGKYNDFANANKYIEEGRRIFKNKALETARKANSDALSVEDRWFSRPHYAYALAQYCKARKITPEQITAGKDLGKAREYAVREAQKATYQDTNALSHFFGRRFRFSERGEHAGAGKVGNLFVEGLLPFRKTPANILARGLEYSPLGLMNGIKQSLWDVQKGRITGAEAIDNISAGLTGTGLLALGVYLAAQGLVRGHGGEDEKKKGFEELMGHQAYSLELPDNASITLDWLAPECLPFFVGVNLYEMSGKENEAATLSDMIAAVTTVSEPMLEMSCLQSLNDVFDAAGYASSKGLDGLPAAMASVATSYLTQGFPTILGQLERSIEDRRYTTYTEKNAFLTGDMQYTLGRISARLPGVDYQQIPYIDAWGRVEYSGQPLERAFSNFLNPAYTSEIDTSKMEEELLRLYEATGEGGVFPSRADKYFTVDKKRKDLTALEYVAYATEKGQRSRELLQALTQSSEYRGLSDEQKVKAVKDAYDLANQEAKKAVDKNYDTDAWMEEAEEANRVHKIPENVYLSAKARTAGIESLKDKGGEAIPDSKGLQIMAEVWEIKGLTDSQRQAMFEYLGVGKSIRHYAKALVQRKLEIMRKKAG